MEVHIAQKRYIIGQKGKSVQAIEKSSGAFLTVDGTTVRIAGAAALAIVLLATSACSVSWRAGATHGAIVEPAAARASVGIWRAPTGVLFELYRTQGIGAVQRLLCDGGRFPAVRLSVKGVSVSVNVLKQAWCRYVYRDAGDLRGALIDAQRSDDCLALTLISRGRYTQNWTHKGTGCRWGALG